MKTKAKKLTYFQKLVLIDERFIGWLSRYFGSFASDKKEISGKPFILIPTGMMGSTQGFKTEGAAYKYLNSLPAYKLHDYGGALLFDVEAGTSRTIKVNVTTTSKVS